MLSFPPAFRISAIDRIDKFLNFTCLRFVKLRLIKPILQFPLFKRSRNLSLQF